MALATVAAVSIWVGTGGATPFGGVSASGSDTAAVGAGCEHVLSDGSILNVGLPATAVLHGSGSAPLAVDDTFTLPVGSSLRVSADGVLRNDTDPEGDRVAAVLVSTTSYGALALDVTGAFEYVPKLGFKGIDSFQYVATDGAGMSAVANVIILVGEQSVAGPTDSLPGDAGTGSVTSVADSHGSGSGSSRGSSSSNGSGDGTGSGAGSATAVAEAPTGTGAGTGTTTVTVTIGDISNTVTTSGGGSTTTVNSTTGGNTSTVTTVSPTGGTPSVTLPPGIPVPPVVSVPPVIITNRPFPDPSPEVDEHDDGDGEHGERDDRDHGGDGDHSDGHPEHGSDHGSSDSDSNGEHNS